MDDVSEGFPGERPEHHMKKLARAGDRVGCGSCRQFDGTAWCRRWNYHTEPASPICDQYRPQGKPSAEPPRRPGT
jgi:hypothetical protein